MCIQYYKEQIRNIFWVFIMLTNPSVLQELDFIIYTRGGGSWYFRPSSRVGLANFTPIASMGHLISETKFKIPTLLPLPLPPPSSLLISDKSQVRHFFFLTPLPCGLRERGRETSGDAVFTSPHFNDCLTICCGFEYSTGHFEGQSITRWSCEISETDIDFSF